MKMTRTQQITGWLIGIVLAIILVWGAKAVFGRSPRICVVCQRTIDPHWAFKIVLQSGKSLETCCCRCGFRYVMTSHQPVRAMWATDFFSGKRVSAQKAVYVSDSRLTHCAPTGLQVDWLGSSYVKVFDRCLPSLVAFKDRREARRFQKQYGGQIMTETQVFASDKVISSARRQSAATPAHGKSGDFTP
jgi:hypothetical protein